VITAWELWCRQVFDRWDPGRMGFARASRGAKEGEGEEEGEEAFLFELKGYTASRQVDVVKIKKSEPRNADCKRCGTPI